MSRMRHCCGMCAVTCLWQLFDNKNSEHESTKLSICDILVKTLGCKYSRVTVGFFAGAAVGAGDGADKSGAETRRNRDGCWFRSDRKLSFLQMILFPFSERRGKGESPRHAPHTPHATPQRMKSKQQSESAALSAIVVGEQLYAVQSRELSDFFVVCFSCVRVLLCCSEYAETAELFPCLVDHN